MAKKEFLYKILLLGDSTVGKSSILMRYVENTFQESYLTTVGLDFKIKSVKINDENTVRVQIWDTAGQDRFRSITRNYFKGAHGIILIYDVTLKDSFYNVRNWLKQIREEVSEKVCIVLVGNKIDKEQDRIISTEEGEKIANEYGLKLFECSAKTGENIEETFLEVIKKTVENFTKVEDKEVTKLKNKKDKKKGCC